MFYNDLGEKVKNGTKQKETAAQEPIQWPIQWLKWSRNSS